MTGNRASSIEKTAGNSSAHYLTYLIVIALAGWALASYDLNLLVLALPDIARSLKLSEANLGVLGFFVYGAQFAITIGAGYAMDQFGRRRIWMVCLAGAAIFTGLTFFVQTFWQLVAVRAIASGLAYSELAVSITIVNEQVPASRRGLLYSIVQGGWPLGVFLAAGVYLAFGSLGWRTVFLLGVLPIAAVIAGRFFVRESDRFENVRKTHSEDAGIALDTRSTIRELFAAPGYIRRQLILLSVTWIFYGTSYVATNFYIVYWLTRYKHFSGSAASTLMLACGGIGFFFYILGGWLGELYGRRQIIIVSGALVAPLSIGFFLVQQHWLVIIVYFLLYQATNGTWSGAGYAYQGESFPTRMRGTAVGFLGAMQVLGFVIGSILWTFLAGFHNPEITWFLLAVLVSLGTWTTLWLRNIPPGQELESIAQ